VKACAAYAKSRNAAALSPNPNQSRNQKPFALAVVSSSQNTTRNAPLAEAAYTYTAKQSKKGTTSMTPNSAKIRRSPRSSTGGVSESPAKYVLMVPGKPHPKARPRFKVYGKKVIAYTDAKTKDAERRVAAAWRHATGGTPETDTSKTYRVGIDFYLATRRRVDLDNLAKTVLDALNGKAWADDTQIYAITARKHISKETEPHTIITVETI
jgi:Holliday junction resolvase RusA-like endonuclease